MIEAVKFTFDQNIFVFCTLSSSLKTYWSLILVLKSMIEFEWNLESWKKN